MFLPHTLYVVLFVTVSFSLCNNKRTPINILFPQYLFTRSFKFMLSIFIALTNLIQFTNCMICLGRKTVYLIQFTVGFLSSGKTVHRVEVLILRP